MSPQGLDIVTAIRVDLEQLTRAKMSYPFCGCVNQFCAHRGRCGEPLEGGWKIRLSPPRTDFGEPKLLTPDGFDALLSATVALCHSCAAQCPNPLAEPSDRVSSL